MDLIKFLCEVPNRLREMLGELAVQGGRESFAFLLYNNLVDNWNNLMFFTENLKHNWTRIRTEDLITQVQFWKVVLADLDAELKTKDKKYRLTRGAELVYGYIEMFVSEVQWLLEKFVENLEDNNQIYA